jgi:hypothetical protein
MLISGFGHLTAKPKIHGGGPEQKPSERRVPGAIKNVAGYDEQIFSGLPRTNAPVESDNDHIKDNERKRIEEHGETRSNYIVESAERVPGGILRQIFRGSGTI